MKRIFIIMLLCIGIGGSLWAELRFDLGMDLLFNQSSQSQEDDSILFNGSFLPIPEVGFNAQFNLGIMHFGAGLRGFSYILYTSLWPAVYMEVNVSKFTFHAQVGGFIYGVLDLTGEPAVYEDSGDATDSSSNSKLQVNKSIIPEISVWYRFGKFFRLGGGWIMLVPFEEDQENIFRVEVDPRFYVGIKMSFPSEQRRMNPNGTQKFF